MKSRKKFVYWDQAHYVFKQVEGNEEECLKIFHGLIEKYPTRLFGTHVCHREMDKEGNVCGMTIKRFKTKKLCKKHLDFPPTYVREGKVL